MISFWRHVETEGVADPVAAGRALADCHEALRSFSGSLPVLSGVTEAEALLMKLAAEEALDHETATKFLHRLEDLHATLGSLRSPDPAPARRRAPQQRPQRPGRAAVERLGGHLRRPARVGRGVPDADPRTAASERRRHWPPPASTSTQGS